MAQYTFTKPELDLGINQGVSMLNRVEFSPTVEQSFNVHYSGGITARYIIQKNFGIQAELNYTQRGWSEKNDNGNKFERRLDYLELPFVSHIRFGKNHFRFFINMGPKIRYLIHQQATEAWPNGGVQQTKAIDHAFDYSLFGGLGIELRYDKVGCFLFEARYDYGLGNIFTSSAGDDFKFSNNTAILLSIAYLYNVLK